MLLSDTSRDHLILKCKEYIEADGIAIVSQVFEHHKASYNIINIKQTEIIRFAHYFVKNNPQYDYTVINDTYCIVENRNHEINESVLETNKSVRITNTLMSSQGARINLFTGATALFAFASVVVGAMQCGKPNEKLQPEVQQINTQLQRQNLELSNLIQTQRNVNFHLVI